MTVGLDILRTRALGAFLAEHTRWWREDWRVGTGEDEAIASALNAALYEVFPHLERAHRLLEAVEGCKVDQRWTDDGCGYVAGVVNPDGVLIKDANILLAHLHYYLEGVDGYEELRALRAVAGEAEPPPFDPSLTLDAAGLAIVAEHAAAVQGEAEAQQ